MKVLEDVFAYVSPEGSVLSRAAGFAIVRARVRGPGAFLPPPRGRFRKGRPCGAPRAPENRDFTPQNQYGSVEILFLPLFEGVSFRASAAHHYCKPW